MKFILIARIEEDDEIGVILEIVHGLPDNKTAVDAIRSAVADWAATDAGLDALRYTCRDFNWGDFSLFLDQIPLPQWIVSVKHIENSPNIYQVNHDEHLMPEVLTCPQCHSEWAVDDMEFRTSVADHGMCPECHKAWQHGELDGE